jgi:hypothetical protein
MLPVSPPLFAVLGRFSAFIVPVLGLSVNIIQFISIDNIVSFFELLNHHPVVIL